MTSYIFNSKGKRRTRAGLAKLYLLTFLMIVTLFLVAETATRYHYHSIENLKQSVPDLMARLPEMTISGREIGNQTIAHNVALFNLNTEPEKVTTGYVGTSRSKILQPSRIGLSGTVIGAGNSYSEISYGLILQAEILRLRFPNLKTVYVEASLLLRRPSQLIIEPDHLKYMPLLQSLKPLCVEPEVRGCEAIFASAEKLLDRHSFSWKPALNQFRGQLRFSSLLTTRQGEIRTVDDPMLKGLNPLGERKDELPILIARDKQIPEVKIDNIKVQRLRDIPGSAPWDGMFDIFARWGKLHNIKIVYFQPPVRADLYNFQKQFGLDEHVADLKRLSAQYQIPFIDLDKPEVGLIQDWTLFSDEDHMGTCRGSALLMLALEQGHEDYQNKNMLEPLIQRAMLNQKLDVLATCKEH
ncbi:hypothetical protein [Pseudomonas sp. ICMP 561]|uniref:hypothetical protein n=1 Tax=Pseudomonas sp. ICMP 561 TaxID=1718918 RepID=UPI0011458C2C|nr:hypothetical protein [Pseudomonas sp. ICMP 561]